MAKAKKPVAKAAAKKPAAKIVAKSVAKVVAKITAKVTAKKAPAKPAKAAAVKAVKPVPAKPVKAAAKPVDKAELVVKAPVKPAEPKDQGDLLIEKAKEEMASVNADAKQAEKASKIKPIKIERGNLTDEKAKWQELSKRYGKDKAQPYKMTDIFESMKPVQHKILGWGFVLTNENNRLEVLFENGIKMLISNYKPS